MEVPGLGERSELAKRIAECAIRYKDPKNGKRERFVECCYCGALAPTSIVSHLKREHPDVWDACVDHFRRRRGEGWSLKKIMWEFGRVFSWSVISRALGGGDLPASKMRPITRLEPTAEEFSLPVTSRWSFPSRGAWANHDSSYRGNWAPQIPRALILTYTEPGELVLDPFLGGGTTAIESLLLGRNFVGVDINPQAVETAQRKVEELRRHLSTYLPLRDCFIRPDEVSVDIREGDARSLTFVPAAAVKLACLHPPYLDTIPYTGSPLRDLSTIYDPGRFRAEMKVVAEEIHRVVQPGGYCALLVGDVRRNGQIIPLGFMLMTVFQRAGFGLREVIIKDQHNCRMAEFWRDRRFFPLAHEHLFVFQKPRRASLRQSTGDNESPKEPTAGKVQCVKGYGEVTFGEDGFCPVAGTSVFAIPCSRCPVASLLGDPGENGSDARANGSLKRKAGRTSQGRRRSIRAKRTTENPSGSE